MDNSTIKIGFSYPKSKLAVQGPIFATIMGTPYDHVYLQVNIDGQELIFQATSRRVNLTILEVFLEESNLIKDYQINLTKDQYNQLLIFIYSTLGRKYDFLGVLGFLWVLLGRKLGKKWANPLAKHQTYFCSELISTVLKELQFSIKRPADVMSPKDIEEWLRSRHEKSV